MATLLFHAMWNVILDLTFLRKKIAAQTRLESSTSSSEVCWSTHQSYNTPTANIGQVFLVQPKANPKQAGPVQPAANPKLAFPVQPTANNQL